MNAVELCSTLGKTAGKAGILLLLAFSLWIVIETIRLPPDRKRPEWSVRRILEALLLLTIWILQARLAIYLVFDL